MAFSKRCISNIHLPRPKPTPRSACTSSLQTRGQIADRLDLSVTTVKTHIANLLTKTGCANRVQLAIYGHQRMA